MNQTIVEKIKALLRLAQSANPHEAALAMEKAFALANRHGVEVSELDLDERMEGMCHAYHPAGLRVSYLRARVYSILIRFFSVEVCITRPRVCFIGRETDVAIAGYVCEFLVAAGSRGLREFVIAEKKARRVVSVTKKKNYVQGFIYGIASQLNASQAKMVIDDKKSALVVAEKTERQNYFNKLFPSTNTVTVKPPRRNVTAMGQGWTDGKSTHIRTPLQGTSAAEPLMLQ